MQNYTTGVTDLSDRKDILSWENIGYRHIELVGFFCHLI